MADEENLIPWDEPAFRLELTAAQLKVTHTALKVFFDDLGHKERDVQAVVLEGLSKPPSEHDIRAIHPRLASRTRGLSTATASSPGAAPRAAPPRNARGSVRGSRHHSRAVQVVRAI